jgi:ubiquinone/menaquinone biosynthesis C-methylase UbiE
MTNQRDNAFYDSHWENFASLEYPAVKIEKCRIFFRPVFKFIKHANTVLDIGCGDGVHWNYLKRIEKLPVNYFGVDISAIAVNYLKSVADKNDESFFVMDACNLDFPDNRFDMVFSYGVIGYTGNPQGALEEMYRVCKPGGWIGVFSPDIIGISKSILFALRSVARLFGNRGKIILADILVPFFGLAPSQTQITLKNAKWRQVREVILTDIGPLKLEVIKYQEVINLVDQLGVIIRFDNSKAKTTIWGLKP